MTDLAVVRCGAGCDGRRLARLYFDAGELLVEWADSKRPSVTWDGAAASDPLRNKPARRVERRDAILDARVGNGDRVIGVALMVLECRSCGTVHGPSWNDFLAAPNRSARGPVKFLAHRPAPV